MAALGRLDQAGRRSARTTFGSSASHFGKLADLSLRFRSLTVVGLLLAFARPLDFDITEPQRGEIRYSPPSSPRGFNGLCASRIRTDSNMCKGRRAPGTRPGAKFSSGQHEAPFFAQGRCGDEARLDDPTGHRISPRWGSRLRRVRRPRAGALGYRITALWASNGTNARAGRGRLRSRARAGRRLCRRGRTRRSCLRSGRMSFHSFPGSAWERKAARLCLASGSGPLRLRARKRGRASCPCVPRQSLGTSAPVDLRSALVTTNARVGRGRLRSRGPARRRLCRRGRRRRSCLRSNRTSFGAALGWRRRSPADR